jgi:peptidoglycan/LPS O-acetylase OafA/YrhL
MRAPINPAFVTAPAAPRLAALDGLRALAIGWVILFHYAYFWTSAGAVPLVPYGDAYAWVPFAAVGYLGVHLFFMISGFVILLTLEQTRGFKEFMLRRAVRLWPALVILGSVTFLIVSAFGPEQLRVGWWEYALSLLTLPPNHVGMFFGAGHWKWLDGAYWSLWVEVKFYCVIGAMFFALRSNAIRAWIAFEVFSIVVAVLNLAIGGRALDIIDGFIFQTYIPYFSIGLAAYLMRAGRGHNTTTQLLLIVATVHLVLASATHLFQSNRTGWYAAQFIAGQAAILVVFWAFVWDRLSFGIFRWAPLTRIGRASYGVYLLHQNVGLTILSMPLIGWLAPGLLSPLVVIAAVIGTAILVHERVELPVQDWLKGRLFKRNSLSAAPDRTDLSQVTS